jgi:uncharacterized protein (TIGR02118 family)
MIRVSVLYPLSEGSTFDRDYYLNSHMPLTRDLFKSALLKDEIWSGMSVPGLPATYEILLHMYFDSLESFASLQEHSATLMADVPNYTNIQPLLEIEQGV